MLICVCPVEEECPLTAIVSRGVITLKTTDWRVTKKKKRLIDANKAKFFIADVLDTFNVPVGDRMAERLIRTIDALPTEGAVEVVQGSNLRAEWPSLFECSMCGCESIDTYSFTPSTISY